MTGTGAWTGSWTTAAATPARGPAVPRRRAAGLWALLHAQSQLTGPAGAFARAEEDHYRLSTASTAADRSLPHAVPGRNLPHPAPGRSLPSPGPSLPRP